MQSSRLAALVAVALSFLCSAASAAPARAADCRHADAVFYSTDSLRLAQRLQANGSACADYYISATPGGTDLTGVRTGVAPAIRLNGPNFHAMAEIRFSSTAWGSWVATNHATWFDAGVEARRRMQAAGYDVAAGDTWALNEISPDVLAGSGTARSDVREFIRGLYMGDGTMPVAPGTVFVTDPLQITTDLASYREELQSFFGDTAFWADMTQYVRFWGQEVYADTRNWGVVGSPLTQRRDYLNDYLQHARLLASAGPASAAAASTYLESHYTPIANAAYPQVPNDAAGTGFGNTNVPVPVMEGFISSQTYAMRFFAGTRPGATADRLGFAWSPKTNAGVTAATFVELLDRLASSIRLSDSGAATDPGVGACGPDLGLCSGDVAGATFNDAWRGLAVWSPVTNTPAGANIRVQLGDSASVTFAAVTSSGSTQAVTSDTGTAAPPGLQLRQGSLYYDISTTAVFDGGVDVCLGYGGADYTGLAPRLYHLANGGWEDITTEIDPASLTVCGHADSLSSFVVFAAGPPVISVPDTIEVPATDPAGAVVSFLVAATSVFDPAPAVSCSPPSGSVFAIGTTTVECRATDSGGNTSLATFNVVVLGAATQLEELVNEVTGLAGSPSGITVAMLVKLNGVLDDVELDDRRDACTRLEALTRLTRNVEQAGLLPAAEADGILTSVTRIEAVLAC
jgi:hypothetical protein